MPSRLSSDQVTSLTPLLGSLARLVARGTTLGQTDLVKLLRGLDIAPEPNTLAELQRWIEWLTELRDDPSENQRLITAETLELRGLLEAPVLLAVNMVAPVAGHSSPNAPAIPSRGLTSSKNRVDFGILTQGMSASTTIDVRGGPGRVEYESDQIDAIPREFTSEDATITVRAKGLPGGMLWTSLKLVTQTDVLEIPVIAQWEDQAAKQSDAQTSDSPAIEQTKRAQPILKASRSDRTTSSPDNSRPNLTTTVMPETEPIRQTRSPRKSLELALGITIELATIPAGGFLMGSNFPGQDAYFNESPQEWLLLEKYCIGIHPITVRQFQAFIQVTGYHPSQLQRGSMGAWSHNPGTSVGSVESHPVTGVSWDDAQAFCRWLAQLTGEEIRLPTEAEWEKAARGTDGRPWPWGNTQPDAECCNWGWKVGATTPVGMYSPRGDSPYGCTDMSGNVWEWTSSLMMSYPYRAHDGREVADDRSARVVRGGSFSDRDKVQLRCAYRSYKMPDARDNRTGFRICVSG